jgi:1,4-dihydroxy-6-naphthoate synthase
MDAGTAPQQSSVEIRLAHSPDADDAFMFYALATNKVRAPGIRFSHVLSDIETLNREAARETYDVTALSVSAYAHVADRYRLLDCGASFGDGYGPLVVAARSIEPEELLGGRVAVPGTLTTSYLVLKLFAPPVETVVIPFDRILEAVRDGAVEAGLVIHEGQLTYARYGLHRVVDLGLWWQQKTGLPLPLGVNAVRRSVPEPMAREIARAIRRSVRYALDHREEALHYALGFGRELDAELADRFVGMYVNHWTLQLGDTGRRAIRELLARGAAAGLLPGPVEPEFLALEDAA